MPLPGIMSTITTARIISTIRCVSSYARTSLTDECYSAGMGMRIPLDADDLLVAAHPAIHEAASPITRRDPGNACIHRRQA